jgi:hypothetical protein
LLGALVLALLGALVLTVLVRVLGGGKGTVTGEVTVDGKPLPWGRITFASQVGKKLVVSGRISNGKYTIKDCPAGPVKIGVESLKAYARNMKGAPKEMAKGFKAPQDDEAPPPEVVGKYTPIRTEYASPDSSGLEYTVKAGPQEHNIPLQP